MYLTVQNCIQHSSALSLFRAQDVQKQVEKQSQEQNQEQAQAQEKAQTEGAKEAAPAPKKGKSR